MFRSGRRSLESGRVREGRQKGLGLLQWTKARMAAIACLTVVPLFVSCGGGIKGLKGEDQVFLEPDFWTRAEAMFGEDGGGYWLKDKATEVRYEGGNWFVKERYHYQIVVLDADRLEDYADVRIQFGPSSRLVTVKARTITSSGEVIPVTAATMHDKSIMPGFSLYSDRKARVFPMPGFSDRCVIDVLWEREDEVVYFEDEFWFGSSLPVRKTSYAYSLDARVYLAGWRIYYRSYNVDAKPVDTSYDTHFGKLVQWRWDLDNIEGFPDERWMPPKETFMPRVALAGFAPDKQPDDWDNFTGLYTRLLPRFDEAKPQLDRYSEEITGGKEGESEIMQALLDYFGDNIRYVSITIKDSGWRPHSPLEVLENKYGDCKDMSCVAVAILRRRGIRAYPALVRTRDNGPIDPQLAIPSFNHMIVNVESEGDDIWLDPTAAPCPLGYVPPVERDVDALVLRDKEAVWKHIPAETPYGSTRATATMVTLVPTGMMQGESRTTFSGDMGIERKRSYSNKGSSELKEALERDMGSCFREVSLDTCALVTMDEVEPVVRIAGKFTKPSAAIRLEDRMVLRLDFLRPMVAGLAEMPRGSDRKYPLWVPFTFEEIDTVTIKVPEGWEVTKGPMDVASTGNFGSYGLACSHEGDDIVVVIHNQLEAGEYQGNRYTDFIDFWSQARERTSQDIVFSKATE